MKAVCRIMEDMDLGKEQQDDEKRERKRKQKELIEQLIVDKQELNDQLNTGNGLVNVKIPNASRLSAIELRKKMTAFI